MPGLQERYVERVHGLRILQVFMEMGICIRGVHQEERRSVLLSWVSTTCRDSGSQLHRFLHSQVLYEIVARGSAAETRAKHKGQGVATNYGNLMARLRGSIRPGDQVRHLVLAACHRPIPTGAVCRLRSQYAVDVLFRGGFPLGRLPGAAWEW